MYNSHPFLANPCFSVEKATAQIPVFLSFIPLKYVS